MCLCRGCIRSSGRRPSFPRAKGQLLCLAHLPQSHLLSLKWAANASSSYNCRQLHRQTCLQVLPGLPTPASSACARVPSWVTDKPVLIWQRLIASALALFGFASWPRQLSSEHLGVPRQAPADHFAPCQPLPSWLTWYSQTMKNLDRWDTTARLDAELSNITFFCLMRRYLVPSSLPVTGLNAPKKWIWSSCRFARLDSLPITTPDVDV